MANEVEPSLGLSCPRCVSGNVKRRQSVLSAGDPYRSAIMMSRAIATAALLGVSPGRACKIKTGSNKDGRQNLETLDFNDKGQVRITSNGLDSLGSPSP